VVVLCILEDFNNKKYVKSEFKYFKFLIDTGDPNVLMGNKSEFSRPKTKVPARQRSNKIS